MRIKDFCAYCSVVLMSGCATVAGTTNMLTDEDVVSKSAAQLGYSPTNLTLVTRSVNGTDTYAELKANDGKEFHCMINGGNLLTFGMTNPPVCAKKGDPIPAAGFR